MRYIYQHTDWPNFTWNTERIAIVLGEVRNRQGRLIGRMESLGFNLREQAVLDTLTLDIIKSNEIEGELLNAEQVRSSVARHLGMDIAGMLPADRHVDGIVEMMLDATQRYKDPLTDVRLFGWHSSIFPSGRSGLYEIVTGNWRIGPMQVVSGGMGHEQIHFEAPVAAMLKKEMKQFLKWFNAKPDTDPVIKAAVAHLWFVTVHPFDDGNGRIARAIADLQLARADNSAQRFYSMSAQIRRERNAYYNILEQTQKGTPDITLWLEWFLNCLNRALTATDELLALILTKARFWDTHVNAGFNTRQTLMLNKLLDGFEGKLTTSKWAKIAKCSQDTALRDIQDLMDRKVLEKEEGGGRSTSYVIIK